MQTWRRVRFRWVLGLAATLLTTGVLLLPATPAQAHATLVGTNPANGTALSEPPPQIELRFSERVTISRDGISLRDAAGRPIETEPPSIPDDTPTMVVLPVPADLPDGSYVVTFRVVSADSHPISGALVFGVGVPAASLAAVELPADDQSVKAVFTVARWSSYAGLALLAGAMAVFVICWPGGWQHRRARRVVLVGWLASLIGGVASLLLQGPYTAGRSLASLFDPRLLGTTLGTDYGRYLVARLVLVAVVGALVVAGHRLPARARAGAAGVAGIALPITWLGTGHTNASGNPVDLVADVVHLVAMMSWFGGLVLLAICLLPRSANVPPEEIGPILRRFSGLATGAVIAIVVTGLYLAWQRVGSWDALFGTTYGRLLALKVGIIGVLLWLGAISRSVVQRRYGGPGGAPVREINGKPVRPGSRADQQAEEQARTRLRQSTRMEVGTAVAVLAVASALVATPPGVAATQADAQAAPPRAVPVVASQPLNDELSVELLVDPGGRGENRIVLEVTDAVTLEPVEVEELRASLRLPEQNLGPIQLDLEMVSETAYQALGVPLPFSGTWQLDVTVRTSEVDSYSTRFDVPIP